MSKSKPNQRNLGLLIPVKSLATAKTRLHERPEVRRRVAQTLAARTLGVGLQCLPRSHVMVLTADSEVAAHVRARGARASFDQADELNLSLTAGLSAYRRSSPDTTVCILVADLPMLTPSALREVLNEVLVSDSPRHVVDQHATGTTFISVPPDSSLPMVFGRDSATRFAAAGSIALDAPVGMRTDLDTPADAVILKSLAKENCD